ncbi:MAG: ABC transporter permease subunit, partial [Rhodoluna sp.]
MSEKKNLKDLAKAKASNAGESPDVASNVIREIMSASFTRVMLSIVLGFAIGAIFMILFNEDVVATYETFFTNPGDTFMASLKVLADGYGGLLKGAIFNPEGRDLVAMFRPITETFRLAAPLIMAGLGIALTFRVGLFNIGATGQIVMGLAGATWISTRFDLPYGIHMIVAVIVAVICAALWGAVVGLL